MKHYPPDETFDDLEAWPFDNAASNYVIVRGEPQAHGRIDYESADGSRCMGIWQCSPGAFECTERGDELQTIVRGHLILTRVGGESIECRAGDVVFTRKGERVIWDVRETVIKTFFAVYAD